GGACTARWVGACAHPGVRACADPNLLTDFAAMSDPSAVLSDGTILRLVEDGRIRIEPWDPSLVQPASVDLRLGDSFRVFHNYRVSTIDLRYPRTTSPKRSWSRTT